MFTVPAGNALVFSDADGNVIESPTTAPLTRTVTAGSSAVLDA
ncbi:hypothetical protein GCM10025783_21460 [Amnibacterium soli]|jgi:hypothetical protein|uniref:Uncharacterized protein n=1 Tax=Amnibacterium soli TaxID=1282736 RepID=A0ABP8Z866_9MICO